VPDGPAPGGAILAECPFCGSAVARTLLADGGTCPKCLAEIPGEEAPTDPGAEIRAALERRDRRWVTVRNAVLSTSAVAVVTIAGIVAITLALWPKPEVAALLDFDTLDFPMPEVVGSETAMAVVKPRLEVVRASPGVSRTITVGPAPSVSGASRYAPPGGSAGGTATANDLPGNTVAEAPAGTRGTRSGTAGPSGPALGISPTAGSRSGVSLGLEAPRVRRDDNLVLSDPDAIRQMIGEYMAEQIPQLNVCYDRRLKASPALRGRWRLQFTVNREGEVEHAMVEAIERSDQELEKCIASHVEREWEFGKVAMAQPVSRTLRFQPL
jgi:hypothetical protein